MKKFDRGYLSCFEIFKDPDEDAPLAYGLHSAGFRYEDGADDYWEAHLDQVFPRLQFLGAMRPFAKLGKDFTETFSPYYARGKLWRDLLQPFDGLLNIAKGIAAIIIGSIGLLVMLVVLVPLIVLRPRLHLAGHNLVAWIIEGCANIVRGSLQIVTAPLSYLFKIPLRLLLTGRQQEPKTIEEKPEIQRLANEALQQLKLVKGSSDKDDDVAKLKFEEDPAQAAKEKLASLLYEINRKFTKSLQNGWETKWKDAGGSFKVFYSEFCPKDDNDNQKNKYKPKERIRPKGTLFYAESYLTFFSRSTPQEKQAAKNEIDNFPIRVFCRSLCF